MLSSFLSLYIASTLGKQPDYNLIKTAGIGFSELKSTENKPIKDPSMISPIIRAKSSIVTDLTSNEVLYEKNSHQERAIASITKLMTMLIILDENKPDDIVTVSNNAAKTEGSTMFLRAGEKITVENLIYGSLINSANDAAVALAEHNAGSVHKFVEKMNKKATELQLLDSNFSNPIGLDNGDNYSSAYDVAKMAQYLYQNNFIKKAAKIKKMDVRSVSGNLTHKLESTNELLGSYLKINGLKTGTTDAAGACLVAIAENANGREIITVVLASPDRFQESKILIDWIFRAYKWQSADKAIASTQK